MPTRFPQLHDQHWLRSHAHLGPTGISRAVGCSYSTAAQALRTLGSEEEHRRRWSASELQVLRDLLFDWGGILLAKALNRGFYYLYRTAKRCGIKKHPDRFKRDGNDFWGRAWPTYLIEHIPGWLSNGSGATLAHGASTAIGHFVFRPGIEPTGPICAHCGYLNMCREEGVPLCEDLTLSEVLADDWQAALRKVMQRT